MREQQLPHTEGVLILELGTHCELENGLDAAARKGRKGGGGKEERRRTRDVDRGSLERSGAQ